MDPTGDLAVRYLRAIRDECPDEPHAFYLASEALEQIQGFGDWLSEYLSRPVDREKLREQVAREREVAVRVIEMPAGSPRPSGGWPKVEHTHVGWERDSLTHTHTLPPFQHRHSGYESVRGVS